MEKPERKSTDTVPIRLEQKMARFEWLRNSATNVSKDLRFGSGKSEEDETPCCQIKVAVVQKHEPGLIKEMKGHTGGIERMVVCRDGRTAVSYSSSDKSLRVWDLEKQECRSTLPEVHKSKVQCVSVDQSGKVAVSTSASGTGHMRVWDLGSGENLHEVLGPHSKSAGAARAVMASNGRVMYTVAARDDMLHLWDLDEGCCKQSWRLGGRATGLIRLGSNGYTLVVGLDSGALAVWDLRQPPSETPCLVLEGHITEVTALAVSADGLTLVSGSMSGSLTAWKLDGSGSRQKLDGGLVRAAAHSRRVCDVAVSADGQVIVSGSEDGTSILWELKSGKHRMLQGKPAGGILTAAFRVTDVVKHVDIAPDGSTAVTTSLDMSLRVWDLHSGDCIATLTGHTGEVTALRVIHGGKRAVSASLDGTIRLWDI